jgi:hypothetical protein
MTNHIVIFEYPFSGDQYTIVYYNGKLFMAYQGLMDEYFGINEEEFLNDIENFSEYDSLEEIWAELEEECGPNAKPPVPGDFNYGEYKELLDAVHRIFHEKMPVEPTPPPPTYNRKTYRHLERKVIK